MNAEALAGIDIYGRVLRYAEVERYGPPESPRYRLLRLGSCDFDFDVAEEVLMRHDAGHVSAVSNALQDVFTGSIAKRLHITLHPPGCYSFFSPLREGSDSSERKVRLQQEAALLAGTEEPLHITADAVRAQDLTGGNRVDWVHVLAVENLIQERVDAIVDHLPQSRRRMMVSMHAAASAISRIQHRTNSAVERGPYTLAIGWYAGHVEYVICYETSWYFSKYTDAVTPVDAAYFAVAVLDRFGLNPRGVERVFVYGNDVDLSAFSDLEAVFDLPVRRLDPLSVIDLDSGRLSADFASEAYVGCVGATLSK